MFGNALRKVMIDEQITISALARQIDITPQGLSFKLKKDNFKEEEMRLLADKLGYDIEITFKKREQQ